MEELHRRASGNTMAPLRPYPKKEVETEIPVKTLLVVSVGALALGAYLWGKE